MTVYLVAAVKPWNLAAFHRHSPALPGTWHLIDRPQDLTIEMVDLLQPRYIFFPHWSWLVEPDILERAECVCFHAADVPHGRGGSPVQNLIAGGQTDTMLSALRMVEKLDAGPDYLKKPMSLAGRGQDIFERMADLVWEMIASIVATEPKPLPQVGEAMVFPRRRPEQSRLPESGDLAALYDHIRMLDVDTYPHAFLLHGGFRLEFRYATLQSGQITASVIIRPIDDMISRGKRND